MHIEFAGKFFSNFPIRYHVPPAFRTSDCNFLFCMRAHYAWMRLSQALESGQLAGAGLDVYINEPPTTEPVGPIPRLLNAPNVFFQPHSGSATVRKPRRFLTFCFLLLLLLLCRLLFAVSSAPFLSSHTHTLYVRYAWSASSLLRACGIIPYCMPMHD